VKRRASAELMMTSTTTTAAFASRPDISATRQQ
jgi:hypothetical protein